MRKIFSLLSVVIFSFIITGCGLAPLRIEAMKDLTTVSEKSEIRKMNVAVILTENTRNTFKHLIQAKGWMGPGFNNLIDPDDAGLEKIMKDILGSAFGGVVPAVNFEDAYAKKTQIVAVVDIYGKFKGHTLSTTTIDITVDLRTLSGASIGVAKGSSSKTIGWPATPNWRPVAQEGLEKVTASLAQLVTQPDFASKAALPTIAATSPVNEKSVMTASVTKSDVDELPAAKAKLNKNAYAIVIGVEQYRQNLSGADFAAHDARVVTEYLTRALGFPEGNIITLLNDRALKSDLEKYFERWLPNNVEKDSTVFIYYSGLGTPNPKTGDGFLVPYDGDPAFIDQTGYSLKRLYENLNKLKAEEVVVVLDSCFSGAGGRSVLAKGARPLVIAMDKAVINSGKIAVLTASSENQISSAYSDKSHGLFTYFMLKGIKEGSTDIEDLYAYLKPQVERVARKQLNSEQMPQLIAEKNIFLLKK